MQNNTVDTNEPLTSFINNLLEKYNINKSNLENMINEPFLATENEHNDINPENENPNEYKIRFNNNIIANIKEQVDENKINTGSPKKYNITVKKTNSASLKKEQIKRKKNLIKRPAPYQTKPPKQRVYIECSKVSLTSLKNILKKVYFDQKVTDKDIQNITDLEKEIFRAILKRKQINIGKKDDFKFTPDYINSYYQLIYKRRNEEYLKFIFMNTFKFLMNSFKFQLSNPDKKESKNSKNKEITESFYKYYFGHVALKYHRQIEEYHLPKRKNKNNSKIQNSINKEYRDLVSKSMPFMNDFKMFLNGNFPGNKKKSTGIRDIISSKTDSKIQLKIKHWEGIFREYSQKEALQRIIKNINSKRFKLPWTLKEVDIAIQHVKNVFKI